MTTGALLVIAGALKFCVRIVASLAIQLFLALEEATALDQIDGLVANVPGVCPIGCRAGLTVTGTALFDSLSRPVLPGIVDLVFGSAGGNVRLAGTVAGLAIHAILCWFDPALPIHLRQAGGMATEATEDLGPRVEDAVLHPGSIGMAWSQAEFARGLEPAFALFDILAGRGEVDPGDGVRTGSESPVSPAISGGQGFCVSAQLMQRGLRGMTPTASLFAGILR